MRKVLDRHRYIFAGIVLSTNNQSREVAGMPSKPRGALNLGNSGFS